ncbi:tripartite tricarboxylate transporter TctB family protein [Alkalihalophilus marmarensis]|uniref:DUF1468 domain-containing protein n=1 Tax=Alkalihalophilus marmarensis DSM 21297 TaxID=1188261 RepID=U6SJE4_9BACI|nr:tripartite tricarboxylate transporter TctB family protein [Alkalihalophilus marmarensis]ERN51819.1 hypothetical protein A33I_18585 [Alkalihalophilus marmarensis DSM 21297]
MKKANVVFNAILILLSGFFFYQSLSFPSGAGGVGPAFFPRIMLVSIILICTYNLIVTLINHTNEPFFKDIDKNKGIAFCVVVGSMAVMIFLLGKLPFILIASTMLFIQCIIMRLKILTSVLTASILSVSVYLIFVKGFNVLL